MDEIMSIAPNIHRASAYLLRFDEPRKVVPTFEEISEESESAETASEVVHEPNTEEIDAIREEYNRLLTVYQEQQQNIELMLADARNEWTSTQGRRLAEKMTSAIAIAFDSLRADVARVLEPVLGRRISEMSVSDLIAAVQDAMHDVDRPFLRVEGPKNFIECFAAAINETPISFEVNERDETDLSVFHQSSCIETRMRDWGATVRKIMEEDR